MNFKEKPWGRILRRTMERRWYVDEIEIERGGYSSIHYHEYNSNTFTVLSGQIRVITYNPFDITVEEEHVVNNGKTLTIEAGIIHRFFCTADSVVTEYYSVEHLLTEIQVEIVRLPGRGNGKYDGNYKHFSLTNL